MKAVLSQRVFDLILTGATFVTEETQSWTYGGCRSLRVHRYKEGGVLEEREELVCIFLAAFLGDNPECERVLGVRRGHCVGCVRKADAGSVHLDDQDWAPRTPSPSCLFLGGARGF